MAIRNWVIGSVLFGVALGSSALSIGRARSATLLGKPLDFSVPLALDPQEDTSQLCPEADVYFGDSRLGSSSFSVSVSRGGEQDAVLRVRTTAVVDEPVVTVFVRAGCNSKSQRKFVLLTDVETELATPSVRGEPIAGERVQGPAPRTASAGQVPQSRPSGASLLPRSASNGSVVAARGAGVPRRAVERPRSVVRKEPPKSEAQAAAGAPASRLRVDTLDPLAELIPSLKGSGQMFSSPNEEQRRTAAALWRAINAQPQDVLRDAERLLSLETNVKTLQAQTLSTQSAVSDVKMQLEQARKERYANPLVFGLAALALLSLGLAAYLWSRTRATTGTGLPWWTAKAAGGDKTQDKVQPRVSSVAYPAQKAAARINTEEVDEYTTDMLELPEGDDFTLEHVPAPKPTNFAASESAASRAADAEELFDIQQQADFFISLGQYDQAIEVLQNHISDNVETSALAYLDLLDLYVKLGRREEYDALRQDFNRVFNGQVPDFDNYSVDGRGIEAYQTALSRIEQLWNEPKVLGVIEESLFRKPDAEGQAFDLQAYRELLLLYSVAKDTVGSKGVGDGSVDLDLSLDVPPEPPGNVQEFSMTSMQPLSTKAHDRSVQTTPISERDFQALAQYTADAKPSPGLTVLDIDLGEIEPDGAQAPAAPSQWIEFDLDELRPKPKK